MRARGMVHGERPSFARLTAAAREHTESKTLTNQAVIDIVTGKTQQPADEIVRALAAALHMPVREVGRWVGRELDPGTPYVPPNGADRLSRRQREAVDMLIRVMIEDEGEASHGTSITRDGGSPSDDLAAKREEQESIDRAVKRAARYGKKDKPLTDQSREDETDETP